ncbi:MAG: transglycosylase SLT domain-containing protein [Abitibacteriaceae bacterium]|nr:transglycosylase SLT domain-containing protein [Abditibacteriaceae bacterium]MBV9865126.1 transglycosylase SLT domain-containing protein [Abditibacteriaceae bacterium]
MRKVWIITLGLGAFNIYHTTPSQAQTVNVPVVQAQSPEALLPTVVPQISHPAKSASHPAQGSGTPSPYDRLRKSLHPVLLQTAAEIKAANAGQLNTSLIELKGQIAGIIARGKHRTAVMKVDDANVNLAIGPDFQDQAILHPGANIRAIVNINPNADVKEEILSIFAATDQPEPAQTEAQQIATNSPPPRPQPVATQSILNAINGLIVAQPGTDITLPKSQSSPRNTLGSAYNYDNGVGDNFEAQKPAYRALVQRCNPKLSAAQVDEIATALLTAGYENNIDPRFLAAIIAVESDFDIYCLSSSGAMGLGQLMPFNLPEAHITNAWNPTQNVIGMARLLRGHLNDYRGRPNSTLLAVAAYNAGPGAVRRAGFQVPPGQQVQRYVWKVYYRYKAFAPDMFR